MKKRPLISRKQKKKMQEAGNRRVDNHHVLVKAGLEQPAYRLYPLPISPNVGGELAAMAREIKGKELDVV